jgi:hypothetical protein
MTELEVAAYNILMRAARYVFDDFIGDGKAALDFLDPYENGIILVVTDLDETVSRRWLLDICGGDTLCFHNGIESMFSPEDMLVLMQYIISKKKDKE